jgi:bacillolysin
MTRRGAALGAVLALATTVLAPDVSPAGATDGQRSPASRVTAGDRALARLTADARGAVRVSRGAEGSARMVDVSGARNPAVASTTSPRDAARAHLSRYGALVGVADPGTRLVTGTVSRAVTGNDVVRFTQLRNGLPVIGGAVAVDLHPDRQLSSVTASVSRATVPGATYPSDGATRVALATAARQLGSGPHPTLTADPPQHRLWDPAVLGVRRTSDPTTQARGVWWVEVHAGPAFHRLVLVDDRSGVVVRDLDLNEQVNRVVCDGHNFMTEPDIPCTHDFARTEHGPASKVKDVNDAFALAGVVATFYRRIGHLNLTHLLGVDEGDHRSLSSTVRWCDPFRPAFDCPLANAFWNGVGMFYGQGYASADDVVGHEMTHGVISHNADLFYWGQSGAINESLADAMGEIIDHRHRSKHDSRHSWTLGEDLPHGAIRSMKDPGRFGQPDRMTSRRYAHAGDFDNGGVHTNSGVGNRTFYLISQGGRQGGRTVHGIDGRSLGKSATLYLDVIQHLVSGSDYADLAAVLDHSCRSLAHHHRSGFTRADCRNVHRATLATELRTTPPRAKQPPDARRSCPKGTGQRRVLFASERGKPRNKVEAGDLWVRAPDSTVFPPVAANATSGHTSWHAIEPQDTEVSSLTIPPVALPAGRPAYLWFQQWRLMEAATLPNGNHRNYDGGTVEVADSTRGQQPRPAEGLSWVNGPRDRIYRDGGNPAAGRIAFGRDSRGYLASRLKLTRYAGHAIAPQFTMNVDNVNPDEGWFLDDIRIYTCSRGPVPERTPTITGTAKAGSPLTADPGRWSPEGAATEIRWYAGGERIAGATGSSYTVRAGDVGRRISVKVTATSRGRHSSTFSPATAPVTG